MFSLGSSNMLGRVFNMDGILSNVQTRGTDLINDLNPLGFVSREFLLIKEFILISCILYVLMFDLPPSVTALINRIILDWGRLQNRKKPPAEVMRMRALSANEDAL